MAPDAGFEPATKRLTAAYSTAELIRNKMVRMRGLEPPRREAPDPKSGVSANSTTPAGVKSFKSCDYGKLEYRKL